MIAEYCWNCGYVSHVCVSMGTCYVEKVGLLIVAYVAMACYTAIVAYGFQPFLVDNPLRAYLRGLFWPVTIIHVLIRRARNYMLPPHA